MLPATQPGVAAISNYSLISLEKEGRGKHWFGEIICLLFSMLPIKKLLKRFFFLIINVIHAHNKKDQKIEKISYVSRIGKNLGCYPNQL